MAALNEFVSNFAHPPKLAEPVPSSSLEHCSRLQVGSFSHASLSHGPDNSNTIVVKL